jgi:tetratricopeptide (TPR) repeat protein
VKFTDNQFDTIRRLISAKTTNFSELCKLAALDPSHDFRFANLSNTDFADSDLSGYDFTGANLTAADFRRANYEHAIFDDAITNGVKWKTRDGFLSRQPVIFISYSQKDEPAHRRPDGVQWLSFVQSYLQPAIKNGIFELQSDEDIAGGMDWRAEIEQKLRQCDLFLLLVSTNSMASVAVDEELSIVRERRARGETVHFVPLLLSPTPKLALSKLGDYQFWPRDMKPLSGLSSHERNLTMAQLADEIALLVSSLEQHADTNFDIPRRRSRDATPVLIHIERLPDTPYQRLVGREAELRCLDDAWNNKKVSIISLIAEGGAGKSALVNEWLNLFHADNYRGADVVLGWSFYSQGSKERTTSAEYFLNWALSKLNIKIDTSSASAKGEAIAEAMGKRRVLLVLDGIEPLQHGLDRAQGELKDAGLRAFLRRFASMPVGEVHGLVVLNSRLPVKDIARWTSSTAPVVDVARLSDEAGAALLHDNGVWGTDYELKAAARDFGGHPLALGLLASFLKETQFGDVRRRDHVRAFFEDPENPRHDHARRVMESYEKEWLAIQPVQHAIMRMVGLFDRPATGDSLRALRRKPAIEGLTDVIVDLDEGEWRRAVTRLREVRLLAPPDRSAPDGLDAHPLVREWFGDRLKQMNEEGWRAAHGRLYEHLRDTTREGAMPTLEDFGPLYQAVAHGCRSGRHQEALDDIFRDRILRRGTDGEIEFYTRRQLGSIGSDLAAISWFFDEPYKTPVGTLRTPDRSWVLSVAAFTLRAQGRFAEALLAQRAALRIAEEAKSWDSAARGASNLAEVELLVGEIAAAVATARQSVAYADLSNDNFQMIFSRTNRANALHVAGELEEAIRLFEDAEQRQKEADPGHPFLYSLQGYRYCDRLLADGDYGAVRDRVTRTLEWVKSQNWILDVALDTLTLTRAKLGLVLESVSAARRSNETIDDVRAIRFGFDESLDGLRVASELAFVARGLLARAAFRRCTGDWDAAIRDLDEVEEIAEPGPMKLYLCDLALGRAGLALARIEAFAPLNGLIDDSSPKPFAPDAAEVARLKHEADAELAIAADYIKTCGYHRRDEELAELEAVLRGERKFADLPPVV